VNLAIAQRPTLVFAGIAGVCVAALASALVSQHVFGIQPCPWCVLQRVIFLAIALVAGLGCVWQGTLGRTVSAGLVSALAASGIASALWQHLVAAASASCNLTLADRIVSGLRLDALAPEVFAPRASCADAAVHLLGVPYEFWSLALFVLIDAAALWLIVAGRQRSL
jgi:disulfide bond formation protein DsbB